MRDEWQPIETAPKDGTSVLGFDGIGIAIMEWWEPEPEEDGESRYPSWVSYSNTGQEFLSAPTHWMPLPAPPSREQEPPAEDHHP